MQVPYGEGLAIHTGPESCVYARKGTDEALTGEVRAGLLSRERGKLRGADAVYLGGRQYRFRKPGARDIIPLFRGISQHAQFTHRVNLSDFSHFN